MYGTEKSDLPILPEKQANKSGRTKQGGAMEGRGGNKRNAELESTVRTQSRSERKNKLILLFAISIDAQLYTCPETVVQFHPK